MLSLTWLVIFSVAPAPLYSVGVHRWQLQGGTMLQPMHACGTGKGADNSALLKGNKIYHIAIHGH